MLQNKKPEFSYTRFTFPIAFIDILKFDKILQYDIIHIIPTVKNFRH